MDDSPGTLITLAPGAMDLPMLLRVAIDAEQIGVTRLELPPDIGDAERVVTALRDQTDLILTTLTDASSAQFVDLAGQLGLEDEFGWAPTEYRIPGTAQSRLIELAVSGLSDLAATAEMIARGIGGHRPLPVSIATRGGSVLPSLAALSAGGHVRVGMLTSDVDPRQNVALAAKAAGIARLAGRPALSGVLARQLLGLA